MQSTGLGYGMKNKIHHYFELNTDLDLYMIEGPKWSDVKGNKQTYGWREDWGEGDSRTWKDGDGFGLGRGSGSGCGRQRWNAEEGDGEGAGHGKGWCDEEGKGEG